MAVHSMSLKEKMFGKGKSSSKPKETKAVDKKEERKK
jgi:hypothetical protein